MCGICFLSSFESLFTEYFSVAWYLSLVTIGPLWVKVTIPRSTFCHYVCFQKRCQVSVFIFCIYIFSVLSLADVITVCGSDVYFVNQASSATLHIDMFFNLQILPRYSLTLPFSLARSEHTVFNTYCFGMSIIINACYVFNALQ